ncbi:hypothetical protein BJX76DRAFT_319586 [Aspergillus varians]
MEPQAPISHMRAVRAVSGVSGSAKSGLVRILLGGRSDKVRSSVICVGYSILRPHLKPFLLLFTHTLLLLYSY